MTSSKRFERWAGFQWSPIGAISFRFRHLLTGFPLDTLIVPQLGRFVKSYIFPRRYLTRTSSKENGWESPSPDWLDTISQSFGPFFIPISFVPLLYHTLRGLSRGFLARVDFTSTNYELERGRLLQSRVSILLHPTMNRGEVGYCISS